MTKVCRLCLARLQRGSKYFNINAVESFTGFMPYRDQLTTCIPEMALDMIPNPVICNNCRTALKSSYDFKSRCLMVEKKIRGYVESQPPNTAMYNLTEIDTSNLPRAAKYEAEVQRDPRKDPIPILPKVEHQTSLLSNLLTLKKEVMLPNPAEIEITNITSITPIAPKTNTALKDSLTSDPLNGVFSCNHCNKKFASIPGLHKHKTEVHEEDYLCNFCNISFRTLQSLRRHNNQCQKDKNPSGGRTVLTKRPHLPTKAKNHLKRWLFKHTDHPYPTDIEKQQLMKETNLSLLQVENWFINARRRILADLTKLKNMRGKPPRGRQVRRQRRVRPIDFDCEDLLDDEPENLLDDELSRNSALAEGLEEPEVHLDDCKKEVETAASNLENSMRDSAEDPLDNNAMESEENSEEDPLDDSKDLMTIAQVKMEQEER